MGERAIRRTAPPPFWNKWNGLLWQELVSSILATLEWFVGDRLNVNWEPVVLS